MELDPRIIKGKRPLTCFDTEQAKEFLGKECYFSNCKSHYKNLSAFEKFVSLTDYCIGELTAIMDLGDKVFDVDQQCNEFRYCLPCEWVKKPEEPEKKYRAFSLNEFLERYKIGDTVTFRMKKDEHIPEAECLVEYKRMITGYEILPEDKDTAGKGSILLGGCPPTGLARLFEFYELENDGKWHPFGIIDESQE